MDSQTKKPHALVVGATGVIGGAIAKQLVASGEWDITCAARDAVQTLEGVRNVTVDLLDPESTARARRDIAGVTHLFFAAYIPRPTRVDEIESNLQLLKSAVNLAESGGTLERVVLMTGGKYYGVQWGAIKTPARETDPRALTPNFYFDQQDYLAAQAEQSSWSWTNLMPPYVTGYSERAPMNLSIALGVLASLSRHLGLPMRFPGPLSAWEAMHHLADADQIAGAAVWAARSPSAENQMFNIANGDPGRWKYVWPAIAGYFELGVAEPLTLPLSQIPASMDKVWREIAEKHGLRQPDLNALVDWK